MDTEKMDRLKTLTRISMITMAANCMLAVFKGIIGVVSGSTAVLSDAVHTFSDVFSTIIVMAGLKFSSEAADREHPYGHYRIESLVSLLLAFILLVTALYLGYEGVKKLFLKEVVMPSNLALGITVISIAVKEWMFRYTKKHAERLNSSSMLSDAWHHRTDAISSIAVFIGVVGVFLGVGTLDSIAAIAVCIIILKAVYDIGATAVNQLIDRSAEPHVLETIEHLAKGVQGVLNIDLLKTRLSNNVIFVEMEIAVARNLTVDEGHSIAQKVHDIIENSGLPVEHCMVHVNPHE